MNLSEENRTVVVSGVPDTLSSSRMADKLVIHFQRSRSHGGDVENIKYPTSFKGVAFVTFENTRDAEMVIRKKQIMCDKEFPQDYPITVFKFTQDVLFYVNAKVDLSIFGDEEQQETVIQSLQSAHRSVRICLLPSQEGKASVEGPFSAIRDLREDLLQGATASSSSHPGEKHGAPWSSGYSLTSVAAGNGVSQVSSSHPGEKHRAPSSSGYSLTSVAAGNGVSQVSSSHPGEKHGAPSSSGYSLTSVAAGNGVTQVSSGHPGEKHGAPSSSGYSLTSVAAGNGVSQVSSGHPGEKHRAPSSSGYSLTSVAAGNGVSQVSSSHAWEKHRAPSPSSHDHSLSSVVAESRSSRVRSGDGAEVDFRVSRYTWEKKNRAAPSSADHSLSSSVAGGSGASTINQSLEKHRSAAPSSDHSLSSSVAGGSGASTINQSLEKHCSAAPSSDHSLSSSVAGGSGASTINQSLEKHRSAAPSSDHSLSSSVAGGSGESKVVSISHTLEKYIAPSSSDQSLSSMASGSGESKVISSSHTLEKYITPSSSDQSLSSMASGRSGESKVISSSHTLEKYIAPSSFDQSLSSPVAAGTSKVSSGGDVDMEEESTWVDTNLFLYIRRFSKDQFDQCFRNHGVSAVFDDNEVADLTLISLRGGRDSKGLSEVQLTISELTDLVAVWQSTLRIHTIDYRRQDLRERKRLLQICAEVNTLYEDVLYVQKELGVRVIGPSISSHLFTEWVKDRRDQPDKEVFL
ncbi:uncharacterized protein [Oncorhynchus clarkii lewisi]|uniref:uncharacterized protein isoform X2 n=1 Tax=Oncorhynchus clarkii lewisi TaxID=490388 RepID=UPI0039B98647